MNARFSKCIGIAAALSLSTTAAFAGPVIIDGTDSNEHGGLSGGLNSGGWEYMQKALENIGGQVGNGQKIVVDLGTTGSTAGAAISSAFGLSSLVGAGWTLVNIDGATDIANYLSGGTVGSTSLANTGIIYLPTYGNAGGDLTSAEMSAINTGAASIATFVGGAGNPLVGGGLFSQGQSGIGAYGWLTTLIPGIVATDVGGGGIGTNITLTGPGSAAFPGLTNADLVGADPWHGYFGGNLGALQVLGTALDGSATRNIIIGGGAGTTISTPDSSALAAFLPLLAGFLWAGLRFRRQAD